MFVKDKQWGYFAEDINKLIHGKDQQQVDVFIGDSKCCCSQIIASINWQIVHEVNPGKKMFTQVKLTKEINIGYRCLQFKSQMNATGKLNIRSLEWVAPVTTRPFWRAFWKKIITNKPRTRNRKQICHTRKLYQSEQETPWRKRQRTAANPTCSLRTNLLACFF